MVAEDVALTNKRLSSAKRRQGTLGARGAMEMSIHVMGTRILLVSITIKTSMHRRKI